MINKASKEQFKRSRKKSMKTGCNTPKKLLWFSTIADAFSKMEATRESL